MYISTTLYYATKFLFLYILYTESNDFSSFGPTSSNDGVNCLMAMQKAALNIVSMNWFTTTNYIINDYSTFG